MEAITLKDKQMGVISSISTDVHAHAHTRLLSTHTHTHIHIYAESWTVNAVQKSMCDEWGFIDDTARELKAHCF